MRRHESLSEPNRRALNPRARTWRDWHEVNPWLFPLPSELARDPGPIGVFIGRIPGELLRDADRCPDPWADLFTNRFIPLGFHDLFCACASVLPAAIRLVRRVYSRGDLVERAWRESGHTERNALGQKLFPGMWREGAALLREAAAKNGPDLLHLFQEQEVRLLKLIAKKSGKAATGTIPNKPTAEGLRRDFPVQYFLLVNWLRCGALGDPGLCFYSDPAATKLLSRLGWPNYNTHSIEKMHERLGLLKACPKIPYVTDVRTNQRTGLIELNTLDATRATRFEWPKKPLPLRGRIALGERILYAGATS